jgi:hypothetical protein
MHSTFKKLAGTIALGAMTSIAQAAPPQLNNKTISVAFSVSIPARGADGSTLTTNRRSSRVIYVSSQGRVFIKATRQIKRFSREQEIGPGGGGSGGLKFVGDKMVGVLSFASGASQLSISFDPSFQSCTASVIMGAESGKPLVWKGLNGITYTATGKPGISTPSCSISQGNALAS